MLSPKLQILKICGGEKFLTIRTSLFLKTKHNTKRKQNQKKKCITSKLEKQPLKSRCDVTSFRLAGLRLANVATPPKKKSVDTSSLDMGPEARTPMYGPSSSLMTASLFSRRTYKLCHWRMVILSRVRIEAVCVPRLNLT